MKGVELNFPQSLSFNTLRERENSHGKDPNIEPHLLTPLIDSTATLEPHKPYRLQVVSDQLQDQNIDL